MYLADPIIKFNKVVTYTHYMSMIHAWKKEKKSVRNPIIGATLVLYHTCHECQIKSIHACHSINFA